MDSHCDRVDCLPEKPIRRRKRFSRRGAAFLNPSMKNDKNRACQLDERGTIKYTKKVHLDNLSGKIFKFTYEFKQTIKQRQMQTHGTVIKTKSKKNNQRLEQIKLLFFKGKKAQGREYLATEYIQEIQYN